MEEEALRLAVETLMRAEGKWGTLLKAKMFAGSFRMMTTRMVGASTMPVLVAKVAGGKMMAGLELPVAH